MPQIVVEILKTVAVMGALAIVLGLMLAISSKYLAVKIDERIEAVNKMLPGANCGACGCAGCADLAKALVTGKITNVSACKVSKMDARVKIKTYLDQTPGPDGSIANVTL
jgi:Na+-translocating ferredoxin:NAD+ oxidoreductase subunit B